MSETDTEGMADLEARIEALLFAADQPRTVRWLSNFIGAEGKKVRRALDRLRDEYATRTGALVIREVMMNRGRILDEEELAQLQAMEQDDPDMHLSAIEVEDDEDPQASLEAAPTPEEGDEPVIQRAVPAYQIVVRPAYRELVQRLLPPELPRPVLGTLSMIATRQPILQADVIKSRGKRAYAHIKELLAQRLILRRPVEGTFSIQTTSEFSRRYQIDPAAARERRERNARKKAKRAGPKPVDAGTPVAPEGESATAAPAAVGASVVAAPVPSEPPRETAGETGFLKPPLAKAS